jgi:hypothetical protein
LELVVGSSTLGRTCASLTDTREPIRARWLLKDEVVRNVMRMVDRLDRALGHGFAQCGASPLASTVIALAFAAVS